MFTVYVLHSQSFDKIYIGFTSDIEKRLFAHNHISKKVGQKAFNHGRLFIQKFLI